MKQYFLLFLFLTSCATSSKEEKIALPNPSSAQSRDQYIQQASKTKVRIGSRLKQNFDFFYGAQGSYFLVVSSSEKRISFKNYDVLLKISPTKSSKPEQITMALEDEQVASGFGSFREGLTNFEIILNPIHPEIHPPFKFEFQVDLKPSL